MDFFEQRHAVIAHAAAAAAAATAAAKTAKTSRAAAHTQSTFRHAAGKVVGLQRRHGPNAAPSMLLRALSAMVFERESKFSRLAEAPNTTTTSDPPQGGDKDPIFSTSASQVALVFELLSSFADTHLHARVAKLKHAQGSVSRRNIFNFLKAASRLEGQARQMSDTRVDVLTQRIVAVFHSNNRSRPHLLDAAEPNNRSHRQGGKRLKVSGGGVQYDPRTGTWVQQPTVLSTEEAKVDSTQTQEKKPGHSSRYDVISEHARALQELQGAQATLNEAMSKTTDRENNLKSLQDRVAALQARVTELTDDVSAIKSLHNPRDSDLEAWEMDSISLAEFEMVLSELPASVSSEWVRCCLRLLKRIAATRIICDLQQVTRSSQQHHAGDDLMSPQSDVLGTFGAAGLLPPALQAIFSAEGVPSEHEKNKKSNNDDDDYDDEYENEDEYENDDDDDDDDYNSDGFESESPRRRSPKSRTSKASDFNALFRGPGSGHTSPETRIDGKTPQHTTTVMAALLQIPWAEISVLRVALTPRSRSFGTGSKQSVFAATSKFGVTKWLLSALEPVAVNFRGENAKATAIAATVGLVLRQTPFWGGHPTEEPGRSSALPTSATDAVLAALQAQSRLLLLRNRKVLDKVFAARVASAARPVPTEAQLSAAQQLFDPLAEASLLGPKRARREMESLFSVATAATVEAFCEAEQPAHARATRTLIEDDEDADQRSLNVIRKRNLDVSRVAMLTLGALTAATGRLWNRVVKSTVEPFLGTQVSVCPNPLSDDAARYEGVIPGLHTEKLDADKAVKAQQEHIQVSTDGSAVHSSNVTSKDTHTSDFGREDLVTEADRVFGANKAPQNDVSSIAAAGQAAARAVASLAAAQRLAGRQYSQLLSTQAVFKNAAFLFKGAEQLARSLAGQARLLGAVDDFDDLRQHKNHQTGKRRKVHRDALQRFRLDFGLRCIYLTYLFEPKAVSGLALSSMASLPSSDTQRLQGSKQLEVKDQPALRWGELLADPAARRRIAFWRDTKLSARVRRRYFPVVERVLQMHRLTDEAVRVPATVELWVDPLFYAQRNTELLVRIAHASSMADLADVDQQIEPVPLHTAGVRTGKMLSSMSATTDAVARRHSEETQRK